MMFRTLVMGVSLTLFLALGAWGSQLRSADALEGAQALAERELLLSAELLPAMYRLDLEAVRAKALQFAEHKGLRSRLSRAVKSPLSFVQRHEDVEDTLKMLKKGERGESEAAPLLQDPLSDWTQGFPYFIFATDAQGVCVAHTNNPRCYAEDEEGTEFTRMAELFPSLSPLFAKGARAGQSLVDVWVVDHKPMLVSAATVSQDSGADGERAGLVVVGYPLSALANFYKGRLKLDVAFVRSGGITGSSSLTGDQESALEALLKSKASAQERGEGPSLMTRSGSLGALPSSGELSFVVAIDWAGRLKALSGSSELLLFAILAGLLSSLVIAVAFARFIEPFKQIDLGLIEVQNGNKDYWFSYNITDNGLSKTIAQNLDIIVSRYLGRPEPEFEDEP